MLRLNYSSILVKVLSFCLILGTSTTIAWGQTTYEEALASLTTNRDRLLDSYASIQGLTNRQLAWNSMSPSQRGVFLTITDLLGRRSFLNFNDNYQIFYSGDSDDTDNGCD